MSPKEMNGPYIFKYYWSVYVDEVNIIVYYPWHDVSLSSISP